MGTIYRTVKFKFMDQDFEFETKGVFDIVIIFLLIFLAYKVGHWDSLQYIKYFNELCQQQSINLTFQ